MSADGARQPELPERRRLDPLNQLAELVDRDEQLVVCGLERCGGGLGRLPRVARGQPEPGGERDEAPLGAVVEVALEPAPLVVRGEHDPGSRRADAPGELLALGGQRRHRERGQGRDRDVDLGGGDAVASVDHELPGEVGRSPDRERGADRDRDRRAPRAEPEPGPDQDREREVGRRPADLRGDRAEDDQRRQQQQRLDDVPAQPGVRRRSAEGEREREHDRGPAEVAEPPRARYPQQRSGRDHVMERERQRSDDRAHRGRDRERREHADHAGGGRERLPPRHVPAQEPRADQHLEQVAEALADGGADRQRRVVVDEQIPDRPRPATGEARTGRGRRCRPRPGARRSPPPGRRTGTHSRGARPRSTRRSSSAT